MNKMTDKQVEATMADWRKAYAAGTLPQWRIDRIEKIKRWVWEVERGVRPTHDLDTCHIMLWPEMAQSLCNRNGQMYGPSIDRFCWGHSTHPAGHYMDRTCSSHFSLVIAIR